MIDAMTRQRLKNRACDVACGNRRSRCARWAVLITVSLALNGCKSFGGKGPVSEDVAQARQLSQQGLNAMQRGDWTSAEISLSKAVKVCPVDAQARRQYAEAMWHRGEYAAAVEQLQKAMICTPNDGSLIVRFGQMQLELGKLTEARAMVNRALDLDPKSTEAWMLRGRVDLAEGQRDLALADFHRALEFAPKDRDLLYEIAEAYHQLNRPQRALSTLISLRETYAPGEEPQQVYYLEGLALQALGRPADAATSFELALERGSPTAELYYRLGEAQLAAGRRGAADHAVEQALAIDPGHASSRKLRRQVEVASRPLESIVP
ncbi:MAG: tetratricopeptide repeat protein [Pirellulales bacterium]|nr:tetratricopeptide repeat protein [Pirellulales bacterium]